MKAPWLMAIGTHGMRKPHSRSRPGGAPGPGAGSLAGGRWAAGHHSSSSTHRSYVLHAYALLLLPAWAFCLSCLWSAVQAVPRKLGNWWLVWGLWPSKTHQILPSLVCPPPPLFFFFFGKIWLIFLPYLFNNYTEMMYCSCTGDHLYACTVSTNINLSMNSYTYR